jgi:aconitate hydratase
MLYGKETKKALDNFAISGITMPTNFIRSLAMIKQACACANEKLGKLDAKQETYERIHRSNLIGMGILPLQFKLGEGAHTYELDGTEQFSIEAVKAKQKQTKVKVIKSDGNEFSFDTDIRIDTPNEFEYFRHGGILQYVIRSLL